MDARDPQIVPGGACCPVPAVALPISARIGGEVVRRIDASTGHVDFLVPEMHCAACLTGIEAALRRLPGVRDTRANLTTHRVGVTFDLAAGEPDDMLAAIEARGYSARPFDASILDASDRDDAGGELLRSLAVAGFAAGNVMLLSVSVWSGADAATRDLFHWLSALIALPAIAYAGQPFFRSALRGLASGSLNMDVPISIGVLLASAMSLHETMIGGDHAYFDAAIGLLFFLLIGRFLDRRMRSAARSAAARLLSLSARGATRVEPDGTLVHVPIGEIGTGDRVRVLPGDRIAVDGTVAEGSSDVDLSMLTGEAAPQRTAPGEPVFAGTLNLTGPLLVTVTARPGETLLSGIVRLMEAAERSSGRYVRFADRVSAFYAPFVHVLALAAAAGWLLAGAGWHMALTTAVAVLIITCPCALGLAVPAVQVVASSYLLARGIMLKDGAVLEKLASVDGVVLDKTGTLTEGEPRLVDLPDASDVEWAAAAALGGASRHPLARALARAAKERGIVPLEATDIVERPGEGIEARIGDTAALLGRRSLAGPDADDDGGGTEIWFRLGDNRPLRFRFEDAVRSDAARTVAELEAAGLDVTLLSGDRPGAVAAAASRARIARWRAAARPADKVAYLEIEARKGRRILMVGDGLNDAPALAAAFVSMSPANAADISQTAAGIVFTGRNLEPVSLALHVARTAQRLVVQNVGLAVAYNLVAVPLAVAGYATPMIAAIAMSTSSMIVTVNALRLPPIVAAKRRRPRQGAPLPVPAVAT